MPGTPLQPINIRDLVEYDLGACCIIAERTVIPQRLGQLLACSPSASANVAHENPPNASKVHWNTNPVFL
jgi:predicted ABC-class ATPase